MYEDKSPIRIFPTYSIIFKEGIEEVIDRLSTEGLAEKFIIFTTMLSSNLYASHIKDNLIQERFMVEFHDALCETRDGRLILDWLLSNGLKSLNVNNCCLMELYCLLLKYNQTGCKNTSLSKNEQLLYLKLILIANEKRFDKYNNLQKNLKSITPYDEFAYEKLFWPILLPEIDINENLRIEYEMFRLKTFIDGITKIYPNIHNEINHFFHERGLNDYQTYASMLATFYLDFITSYTNQGKTKFVIEEDEQRKKLLSPLVINQVENDSYLSLKSHPVYYYQKGYYVIHWNYLLSQIFIGTFMALKGKLNACGLKDIKKESGMIVEKSLFKNVLKNSFGKFWQHALFDEQEKGLPDAIFRMGNHLFIIEIKDSLMKESIMESADFESIEKYFTETFIQSEKGKKKGIKQLTANINDYIKGKYEKDGFPYDRRLNIYPLIVVTDYKYRLNGLNHFLSVKFDEIIKQDVPLLSARKRIRPLTVIGLDCMFNLQFKFQSKQIKFADSIDNYHKHVKINKKRREYKGVVKFSQLYPSYDRYLPDNNNFLMSASEIELLFKDFFNMQKN
jgi:hypothetical protein